MGAANNSANKSMTMNGSGHVVKGMTGYWSVKPKKRDGGNRKRVESAKQKKRKH